MALASREARVDVAAHESTRHVAMRQPERMADLVGDQAGEIVQIEECRRREEIERIAFQTDRIAASAAASPPSWA